MPNWVDMEDALEQARDMVTTAMVTLTLKNNTKQVFLIEIHGVEQMYKLVAAIAQVKQKKKIKTCDVINLSKFPTLQAEDFGKVLGKL